MLNELERLKETNISTEEIFSGNILHVVRDTVELPDESRATREVIRHIGAVCVIPVTDEGKVVIERQFRYPIDQVITEIPAGKLDSPKEDRLEAAKRELREETGYTADEWIDLGTFYGAAAYTDEKITMYMARGLHKGKQELDQGEFLDVYEVPLTELVEDVMKNRIPDGKSEIAILKAARYLGL
ncbi:MAG: NUDIX hydrolase [Acetatifactor sp.]|nr:NUDIX hydrolase [Acetatifactor sp.]